MIDFTLSEQQKGLQQGARAFARNVLAGAPNLYQHLTDPRARFEATLPIYRQAVKDGLIKGQVCTEMRTV